MPLTEDVPVRRKRSIQIEASQRRQSQILNAAAEAFAARGFNATSLREVASRAAISHTGLLHHYPDKNALLEALLDNRLKGAAELYPLNANDGEAFLRSLVGLAERDSLHPGNIRLLTAISAEALNPDHPAHGYFVRWHAQVRELITIALTDLQQRGLFRGPIPPAEAALHISTMRDGAHAQWLLSPESLDLPATVRSQIRIFVDLEL